ncbi:MAG: sigma-70 family RNA polymerase sigma factor [Armatimonadota bacterium]
MGVGRASVESRRLPVRQLFERYADSGDDRLREELIARHAPLVQKVARSFLASGEPLDDLVQEGYLGLLKAIDSYDVRRDVKFATYATHTISGEIRHYLRDRKSLIRQPGWLHEISQQVARAIDRLTQTMDSPPTASDLARETGLSEEQVLDVMRTRSVFRVASLDTDADRTDDDAIALDRRKLMAQEEVPGQLSAEDKIVLHEAVRKLKGLERRVIYYLFYRELNQTEIAQQLGISCNYVSHLVRSALKKLRQALVAEELREAHLQSKAEETREDIAEAGQVAAPFDDVTGLLTARSIRERLEAEILRASRYTHEVCIALVDLDDFAGFNEKHGFTRSDRLLQFMGKLIRRNIRKVDVVARYAGDTFALLLPRSGAEGGQVVAKRILAEVAKADLTAIAADAEPVSACAGVAAFPGDGTSREEIIAAAFAALTAAKKLGPGTIVAHQDL